jgi:diaminopimelate epimerase
MGPAELASLASSVEAEGCRYQVLPLRAGLPGSDGVAVFAEGGSARVRARIGSADRKAPDAVAVRVISRGELSVSAPRGGGFDSCGAAALALASAAAVGYAEREALVRFGKDGLWLEWTPRSWLYAAGRPEYVYRGEFHLVEGDQASK